MVTPTTLPGTCDGNQGRMESTRTVETLECLILKHGPLTPAEGWQVWWFPSMRGSHLALQCIMFPLKWLHWRPSTCFARWKATEEALLSGLFWWKRIAAGTWPCFSPRWLIVVKNGATDFLNLIKLPYFLVKKRVWPRPATNSRFPSTTNEWKRTVNQFVRPKSHQSTCFAKGSHV